MTVTLTIGKDKKLSSLIKQITSPNKVNIRDIAKVLEMFGAALSSVRYGRLHLFFLQ